MLGSAGAWNIWHDFPNGMPGTWYPQALANKLAGVNLSTGMPDDGTGYGNVDIKTQFNINLGNTGCLDGTPFYLGLDGNAGAKVNFVETLLHELGHGLGFSVLTVNTSNGYRLNAGRHRLRRQRRPAQHLGRLHVRQHGQQDLAGHDERRAQGVGDQPAASWPGSARTPWPARRPCSSAMPIMQDRHAGARRAPASTTTTRPRSARLVADPGALGALAIVAADPVNGAGCAAVRCRRRRPR